MQTVSADVKAGKTRLRQILMTAFATIAALIPLALTTSSGTLISKGLAVTVIGGLTSSALLTLIVVPVVYELFFYRVSKREQNGREVIKSYSIRTNSFIELVQFFKNGWIFRKFFI